MMPKMQAIELPDQSESILNIGIASIMRLCSGDRFAVWIVSFHFTARISTYPLLVNRPENESHFFFKLYLKLN